MADFGYIFVPPDVTGAYGGRWAGNSYRFPTWFDPGPQPTSSAAKYAYENQLFLTTTQISSTDTGTLGEAATISGASRVAGRLGRIRFDTASAILG